MRYFNGYGYRELHSFPGCNQIVISNHAHIYPEFRGKGHGTIENKAQVTRAADMGYDYIMCTVRSCNVPQIKILEKNGWKHLDTFTNTQTENEILIYGRAL